jgi:hypothetical protein
MNTVIVKEAAELIADLEDAREFLINRRHLLPRTIGHKKGSVSLAALGKKVGTKMKGSSKRKGTGRTR